MPGEPFHIKNAHTGFTHSSMRLASGCRKNYVYALSFGRHGDYTAAGVICTHGLHMNGYRTHRTLSIGHFCPILPYEHSQGWGP